MHLVTFLWTHTTHTLRIHTPAIEREFKESFFWRGGNDIIHMFWIISQKKHYLFRNLCIGCHHCLKPFSLDFFFSTLVNQIFTFLFPLPVSKQTPSKASRARKRRRVAHWWESQLPYSQRTTPLFDVRLCSPPWSCLLDCWKTWLAGAVWHCAAAAKRFKFFLCSRLHFFGHRLRYEAAQPKRMGFV